MARLKITPLKARGKRKATKASLSKRKLQVTRNTKGEEALKSNEKDTKRTSGVRYSTRSNVINDKSMETQDRTTEVQEKEKASLKPKKQIKRTIRLSKTRQKKQDGESLLPPDFRTASLLASSSISIGKIFGPFHGKIIEKKRPPSARHSFVCSVSDHQEVTSHFYVHEQDRARCQWLKLVQSPPSGAFPNMVAYNSADGVCYKATKSINPGEEILVQFEKKVEDRSNRSGDGAVVEVCPSNIPDSDGNGGDVEDDNDDGNDYIDNDADVVSSDLTQEKQNSFETDETTTAVIEGDSANNQHSDQLLAELSCTCCKTSFSSKKALDTHIKDNVCRRVAVSCEDCGQDFFTPQAYHKHRSIYHSPARCHACNIDFTTRKEYLRHAKTTHPKLTKQKQCPICKKIFSASYINDHIQAHDKEAFKCNICGKTFSAKGNLQKHKFRHLPGYKPEQDKRKTEKRFRCDHCGKMFGGVYALEIHSRIHTGERPYSCAECSMRFRQVSHLNRHLRISHGKGDDLSKKFKCTTCDRGYSCQQTLDLHLITIHKGQRPFQCDKCQSSFTQRGNLFRHQRVVHGTGSNLPSEECHFICKEKSCDQRFGTQAELNEHVISHTGVHPFHCESCGSNFSSKGNLRKHVRRKHLGEIVDNHKPRFHNKSIKCGSCSKTFYTISQLREHTRMHTGEKIICGQCGQTFSQSSGLRKHLRCLRCPSIREEMRARGEDISSSIYPKSRKWQCEICKKCFTGPSDLLSHARVHSGERPFLCELCNRGFSQPGNLKKHIRYVHEGEKRPKDKPRPRKYDCSLCGKAFLSPGDLSMHCRVHSGIKPYKCDHCDMAFSQRGNLKKHMERWHSGQRPKRWRQAEKLKFNRQIKSGDHETYTKPFNSETVRDETEDNGVEGQKVFKEARLSLEPIDMPVVLTTASSSFCDTSTIASFSNPTIISSNNFGTIRDARIVTNVTVNSNTEVSTIFRNTDFSNPGATAAVYSTNRHPLASLISNFGQLESPGDALEQSLLADKNDTGHALSAGEGSVFQSVPDGGCNRPETGSRTTLPEIIKRDDTNVSSPVVREMRSTSCQTSRIPNESTGLETISQLDLRLGESVLSTHIPVNNPSILSSSAGSTIPTSQIRVLKGPSSYSSTNTISTTSKSELFSAVSTQAIVYQTDDLISPRVTADSTTKFAVNTQVKSKHSSSVRGKEVKGNTDPVTCADNETARIVVSDSDLSNVSSPFFGLTGVGSERLLIPNSPLFVNRPVTLPSYVTAFNHQLYQSPSTGLRPQSSIPISASNAVVTPVVVDGKGSRLAFGSSTKQLNRSSTEASDVTKELLRSSLNQTEPNSSTTFSNNISVDISLSNTKSNQGTAMSSGAITPSSLSTVISYEHPYCSDSGNATNVSLIHPAALRTIKGFPFGGSSLIAVRDPTVMKPSLATFWAPGNPSIVAPSFASVIPVSNVFALTGGGQPLYLTQPVAEVPQDIFFSPEQNVANFLTTDPTKIAQYYIKQPTTAVVPEIIQKQRPHVLISPQTVFPRISVIPANTSLPSATVGTSVHPLSLVSPEVIQPSSSLQERPEHLSNTPSSVVKEGLVTPVIIQSGHRVVEKQNHAQVLGPKNSVDIQCQTSSAGYVRDNSMEPINQTRSTPVDDGARPLNTLASVSLTPQAASMSSRQSASTSTATLYQTPLNSVIVTNQSEQFAIRESIKLASTTGSQVILPEIHNLLRDSAATSMKTSRSADTRPLLTFSSAFGSEQTS